ncbi:tRNA lysidine(34) synthetase TilS [Erwinia psidii]|uniref:tRNA lysidine(34) synthetase TilS n=1 Tax=Erwinia psidii TaxID=69224 RepID=UPI00226B4EF2|nr:tRNA lysidine(34) synthetase TilS [Erwinia psidii]MCX8960793.1 tRNA lysidine(34) synthetase TilS [Erwinia psidii]
MPLSNLEQQLGGHRHLLVAYSGGVDSSVLLHQLVLLRQQLPALHLRAIHIHHGLNPLADSWVSHCQRQCAEWQVLLEVVNVQVDGREKGIEAAARAARYQAFLEHLQPGEVLLTAQHQDDQCETLLLALKRGSGPAGLSGMSARGLLGCHWHLRPLLACSRLELESWAAEHRLRWIEDDSNQDQRYERNFLRQAIMPLLSARWSHFPQAVARSASLCAEQEQLLDELLADSLITLMEEDGSLAIAPLAEMSHVRRSALIRRWIASHQGVMPSRDALLRIWQEVACSRDDAEPRLLLGKYEIRRYRNRLYWLEVCQPVDNVVIEWPATDTTVALASAGGWLLRREPSAMIVHDNATAIGGKNTMVRPAGCHEKVSVRFQAQGKFHIVGRAGSRSLKKLWQELGVPPWQRGRIPMIFYDDQLIAAVGIFVTREGDPGMGPHWQICWQQELTR